MSDKFSRQLGICVMMLWSSIAVATEAEHPLEPQDLSSPRATLSTFLAMGDTLQNLLSEEYWHTPNRAVVDRMNKITSAQERLLDLSEIAPAARKELGRDGVIYLYEVLSRIKLPPSADIPDATAYAQATGDKLASADNKLSWTIPHTEITLVRITEGLQKGAFLFSSPTVARAEEFYQQTRTLPYLRNVPLKNYAEMRPYLSMTGWMISSKNIEGFPDWLKRSAFEQAIWKWIVLAVIIAFTSIVLVLIHRLVRHQLSGHAIGDYLIRFLTPLILLLMPLLLSMVNRQLTLSGWISGGITALAEAVTYFASAWIVWASAMVVAEAIIAASKIPQQSLQSQLIRLVARTFGIAGIIVIILHVSSQLGAPLYGLVAGLGVGGLAIALAVRPTLENILGGLILFTDKPVRIGDFCQFGEESGTVEEIGLRSTRLRKLDDTIVSVPNADFAQLQLTNHTRRRRRLYQTTLGFRYETTPEQLRYLIARLREMLHGHPQVSPDWLHVRFDGFGSYSLDIAIFAYIRTRDWLRYRAIREDINLRIMDIVAEAGTSFAFPSQTTYFGRDQGLDTERGREAETQVQSWRSEGQLPFPEFDKSLLSDQEDALDYPDEGSPDYKPREKQSATAPEQHAPLPPGRKRSRRWFGGDQ